MSDDRQLHRDRLALFALAIRDRRARGDHIGLADLTRAINQLPPKQAAVARLVLLEGKPVARAARDLGIHHSTAQEQMRAAAINLGATLT